ncbi:DJ-1/PfpI family protein [Sphingomonas sp. 22176]
MLRMPRACSPLLLAAVTFGVGCGLAIAAPAMPSGLPKEGEGEGLPLAHVNKRPGALPVVVVVATEKAVLSDFVVPYGVLAQSGVAKVIAVSMTPGDLKAGPLTLVPDMTAAEFDRAYPEGADYVIVPATSDKHTEEVAWLRTQHARGAALMSICDGVELLAEAGLLDGRSATGHWASLSSRRKHYPKVNWRTNTRYVADGDVASSAGVSAALPISLALIETMAGAQVAHVTAERFGERSWGTVHESDAFKIRADDFAVHTANMRAKPETISIDVWDGSEEVALSLQAEAWSRTMRDKVHLVSNTGAPVRLRGGLRIRTEAAATLSPDLRIVLEGAPAGGAALNAALDAIAQRYGSGTARLSALAMEYPWGDLQAGK